MASDSSASSSEEIPDDPPSEITDQESNLPIQEVPEEASLPSESNVPKPQTGQRVSKIGELVNGAILRQKKRKGSTIEEIQTDIVNKSQLEATSARKNIRGYLNRAVDKGTILITGGEGNSRTYKLAPSIRSEMLKANRGTPAKRGRPSAVSAGTTKTLQKTAKAAARKAPTIAGKRGASSANSGPSKRMKTLSNGVGLSRQCGTVINPPRKTGKAPIGGSTKITKN